MMPIRVNIVMCSESIKKEQSISGRIAEAISTASGTFRKKTDADKTHGDGEDPFAVFMQVDGEEQQEEK